MKMNSNPAYRSVVLDCLLDNACNMRKEHQDLASRISIALEQSRANLRKVDSINQKLQDMKVTVNEAMVNISCPTGTETEYMKVACENLLSNLINAAAEFNVVMDSVPIITESDIKETVSNVLGNAAPIDAVKISTED